MVSLLDCIERIPSVMEDILAARKENFAPMLAMLQNGIGRPEEIVLVGSGTSSTSGSTSRFFVEKATGIKTTVALPSDFYDNTYCYNPKGLYVFTSQTGTSFVVRDAQRLAREKGLATLALTESETTPLAGEAMAHVSLCCGHEEYPTRTIGYTASVLTHMVLGLELGLHTGHLDSGAYEGYIRQAQAVPSSHRTITGQAMAWMDKVKRGMLRSQCIVFTGAGALQGVALEAAVKVWELPQKISMGYELEEGLHGPNYGYNQNHCVVVLNGGGKQEQKALSLARWMKDVHKNGYVVGSRVVDDADLQLQLVGGDFECLEIAPVVQVLAYRLAKDEGRDLYAPHDNSVMDSYFKTHDGDMEAALRPGQ